jgi:DNA polymerase-3 subunit delta'
MKFEHIIGQSQIKQQLTDIVKSGRVSHTMLFTGPKGSGKFQLALAYAQYLLCDNPTEKDACGECSSCKRVASLEYPDLHLIYPVIKKKSTDKPKSEDFISQFRGMFKSKPYFSYMDWVQELNAENKKAGIFVSENESLMHKLSLKSYAGKYKIFIFWMLEKVNLETANKLLKALEEPPEKTIFLLISDQTELILPTILSRAQLMRTQMLQPDEIEEGLHRYYDISENEARKFAVFADGNFNKAASLVQNSDVLQDNLEKFAYFFRESYKFDIEEIDKAVNKFKTMSRDNVIEFLQYALFIVRNNMALNQELEKLVKLTDEERDFSQNFSKLINPRRAHLLSRDIEEAVFHINRNVNTRIVMFDLAIKIHEGLKSKVN